MQDMQFSSTPLRHETAFRYSRRNTIMKNLPFRLHFC